MAQLLVLYANEQSLHSIHSIPRLLLLSSFFSTQMPSHSFPPHLIDDLCSCSSFFFLPLIIRQFPPHAPFFPSDSLPRLTFLSELIFLSVSHFRKALVLLVSRWAIVIDFTGLIALQRWRSNHSPCTSMLLVSFMRRTVDSCAKRRLNC